jgi:hypothetical protein
VVDDGSLSRLKHRFPGIEIGMEVRKHQKLFVFISSLDFFGLEIIMRRSLVVLPLEETVLGREMKID